MVLDQHIFEFEPQTPVDASAPLPGLPRGAMVVQDDANPIKEYEQNFKIVSWADIESALGLPQD